MAEAKDTTAPEGATFNAADLSSFAGQSKSLSDTFQEFHEIDQSDKDKYFLICIHCKCKVMRLNVGTLTEKEVRGHIMFGLKIISTNDKCPCRKHTLARRVGLCRISR